MSTFASFVGIPSSVARSIAILPLLLGAFAQTREASIRTYSLVLCPNCTMSLSRSSR